MQKFKESCAYLLNFNLSEWLGIWKKLSRRNAFGNGLYHANLEHKNKPRENQYIYCQIRLMSKDKIILYIDDDADDRELLQIELNRVDPGVNIAVAEDGMHGLAYLDAAKKVQELPCLIVLDLNMPRLDGRQTFSKIREDSDLQSIPVIIYTSSNNPSDVAYFKQRGVQLIPKPLSTRLLPDIARSMVNFCS